MADKRTSNRDLLEVLAEIKDEVITRDEALAEKIDKTYLRIQVFEAEIQPLKKFVYGLITVAGAALVTALMGLLLT